MSKSKITIPLGVGAIFVAYMLSSFEPKNYSSKSDNKQDIVEHNPSALQTTTFSYGSMTQPVTTNVSGNQLDHLDQIFKKYQAEVEDMDSDLVASYKIDFERDSRLYCSEKLDSSKGFCEEMFVFYAVAKFACEEDENKQKASEILENTDIYFHEKKHDLHDSPPEVSESMICSRSGLLEILPSPSIDYWLNDQN